MRQTKNRMVESNVVSRPTLVEYPIQFDRGIQMRQCACGRTLAWGDSDLCDRCESAAEHEEREREEKECAQAEDARDEWLEIYREELT